MAPRDSTININGLELHYLDWSRGSAAGRTCLLLHGSAGHAHIWDHFASKLSPRMRAIALDLRGHGDSEWARPPAYRAEDYIRDLDELIEKLSLTGVVIVAHSMSVFHAIRYAVKHPDRIARLVLVDIEATGRPEHKQVLNNAGLKPQPRFLSVEEAIARERRIVQHAPDELLRSFVKHSLRPADASAQPSVGQTLTYKYDRETLAQFDSYDEWHNLARIRCPGLVVYGAESVLVEPETMRRMARALPCGRHVEIEAAGHLPHLDNPDAFEQAVVEFCSDGL